MSLQALLRSSRPVLTGCLVPCQGFLQIAWTSSTGIVSPKSTPACGPSTISDPSLHQHAATSAPTPQPASPWHQHLPHVRCMHMGNMYSVVTGTPRPTPWPTIEPVQGRGDEPGQMKWNRTVLRPPAEVQIVQQGNTLILSGKAGSVKVHLVDLDPTGVVAFKLLTLPAADKDSKGSSSSRSTIIIASPSRERFDSVVEALQGAVQGVMQGYMVALTVKGVGYRLEPADDVAALGGGRQKFFEQVADDKLTIQYPHSKPVRTLRLRVGFSKPVIYTLPPSVRAFCLRPTLTYLYGLEKGSLDALARDIRGIRKPNIYTGNGIQIVGEVLKLKARANKKK